MTVPEQKPSDSPSIVDELLDLAVLDELQAVLGGELQEIAQAFMQTLPRQMERLQQALAEGALPCVRQEAHSIKGSAGNLGVSRLSAAAALLERAAQSGRLDETMDRAADLADVAERSLAALLRFLDVGDRQDLC